MKDSVRRLKTLIVEDSARVIEVLITAVLAVPGLELMAVADTAADALTSFVLHGPDLVILDLVLRAGSGLDVLREIKQRSPGCRVLVFTAYDDEPYRTRCLAAGAGHFFSKNRQYRDLIQMLHDLSAAAAAAGPGPANDPPP
jgi:DNA-binding NarL/FixJ family response regulator